MLINCDDLHGLSGLIAVVGGGMTASMENGDRVGIFRLEFWDKAKWNSGACDTFTDGAYEILCIVGGVSHSPANEVGVFRLDYVAHWNLYDAVGACIVIICGEVSI